MSEETVTFEVEKSTEPNPSRNFRALLADAFALVCSIESNQALAAVKLEELISDQIKRNGETDKSNNKQYDIYSNSEKEYTPASESPTGRANFLGGSDTGRPTKIDLILAIVNEIGGAVDTLINTEPERVADSEEYDDTLDGANDATA